MKWYTVWNSDDEIVCFGTAHHCAEMLGIKYQSFRLFVSRVQRGEDKRYSVLVEEYREVKEDFE